MRRPCYVRNLLSALVLTASLATPSVGQAAPQDVVRVGDRDMTCTALAAEINTLALPTSEQAVTKPKKRGGFGFLKVLGGAMPFVGMAGGVGGALVSSAAGAAQTMGTENSAADAMEQSRRMMSEAAAGGSPSQQRKERLTAIFEEKRC